MNKLACLSLVMLSSCATVKADLKSFGRGVVACAKADEGVVKSLGLRLLATAASDLFSGKSLDETFQNMKAGAETGAKTNGVVVAACAFDGVIADIEKLLHPQPAVQSLFAGPADVDAGEKALAEFRAAHGITVIER